MLRTQTICAGKIFSGTFTLRTQTICAGKIFRGTFTLRTQTICAGKFFSGTFTLRTQTICAGKIFSGTFTLRTENTCRTACCCYLMLTHTFLHRFRRKQAFLPKKFRKDLRLLRNPKNFSFLPNFLRKNIKILRKRIQAVDPVTQTANNKPSQPFAKFLRKTPKIRPYRVFK